MNDLTMGFVVSALKALKQPKPPCEKYKCGNYENCKTQLLACKSFIGYVDTGRATVPTEPTRALYNRLFDTP